MGGSVDVAGRAALESTDRQEPALRRARIDEVGVMKLSIVMPCYNERNVVRTSVERVLAQPFDLELLIVDDGSTDGTREILAELEASDPRIRVFLQPEN